LKSGLEILADLKNFFESSVDFLPISIGKMRKDHGPSFNLTTIKALLNLRTDLSKTEKTQVLKDSKEVLDQYKDDMSARNKGIFSNIDTSEAAKEFNEDMKDADQEENKSNLPEEEEFNIDDFLKEGGIDVDQLDDKSDINDDQKNAHLKNLKSKDEKKIIVGRENMNGWLFKSKDNLNQDKALLDTVLYTVTDTFHSVVDNINKKRTKRFFRIKKGHLYWYTKEDADKAQNDLDIRKIDQIEICNDNDKMLLIVIENDLYKLEADNKEHIEEWYKSIALVMSKSEEYLNLDRYVDSKVFEKITGKSLFRDFEEILNEEFKKFEKQKKIKEENEKRLRDQEVENELKAEIENNNKLENDENESSSESPEVESPNNETEVRLPTETKVDFEFDIQLNHTRSTAVRDLNPNKGEDLSSLKLYRTNTESELSNFKKEKEIVEVYKKYSNVKEDSMFDLIKRHESASSGNGSDKSSDLDKNRRSATNKGNHFEIPFVNKKARY
jgi:hypothetical protein